MDKLYNTIEMKLKFFLGSNCYNDKDKFSQEKEKTDAFCERMK